MMATRVLIFILEGTAAAIMAIGVGVLIHELAHLAVARACHLRVAGLVIGVNGRQLIAFRIGGCSVSIGSSLLSGSHIRISLSANSVCAHALREQYIASYGDDGENWAKGQNDDGPGQDPSLLSMFMILASGPIANLLTAIGLLWISLTSSLLAAILAGACFISLFLVFALGEADTQMMLSCIRTARRMRSKPPA